MGWFHGVRKNETEQVDMSTLRDLLGVDILSPFWNNLIVSQLMVIYYKIGSELILKYCIRWRLSCRQALHILLSSCVLFWPLFIVRDDVWSWRLNILVPSVMMARFYYKVRDRNMPTQNRVTISIFSCTCLSNYNRVQS